MKVLLVRPNELSNLNTRIPDSLNRYQGILPPLGISYIASSLEASGYVVGIIDNCVLNLDIRGMRQAIARFEPDIVGITVMTSTLPEAKKIAQLAKELGAITVFGGPHMSVYPEETMFDASVDYGVYGEGEKVMVDLLGMLNMKTSPRDVKGLIYKDCGVVCVGNPAIVEDLDSLAFPAYHLLPMSKYNFIIGVHPISSMISSRGCPYQCSFCFKQPSDTKVRFRSPENVVNEMQYIVERFKVREISFYDDAMTLDRSRVVAICEEVISRNLKVRWEARTRVDHIDRDLLRIMSRAGCLRLYYGVESGDDSTLRAMNKKINFGQIKETFHLTKKSGIETLAFFMIGYMNETQDAVKRTIDFAVDLDPDWAVFTAVTPYPNTPLYNLARKENLITRDYWREFAQGNAEIGRIPYFMPDTEYWIKKAYWKFYFRPLKIIKQIGRMRSWYVCKRNLQVLKGMFMFRMVC